MTLASDNVRASIGKGEFVTLIAMMFATIAFSIDSMLPALPEIGKELTPENINRAQLILTSFVLGMGIGTFFTGPLSDAFGRRTVMFAASGLYIAAAGVAWYSSSFELVLAARIVQGLGAAGPRVVGIAIMRDMFSGREMARMMSIAMMVFTIFPAFAPLLGTGIIHVTGWRGIFLAFIVFSLVTVIWMGIRLPESLAEENRRPFRAPLLSAAVREMFAHPTVRISILVQALCLGVLFTMLTMVQPVYDVMFERGASFAFWFAGVALVSGSASMLNAALVVRVGMRRMVTWSLGVQILLTAVVLVISTMNISSDTLFHIFVAWQCSVFFMAGTTLGNLNAIAMEPMGHIAGMAASVIGAVATVCAAAIAAPVGLMFDGSLVPLTGGVLTLCIAGFAAMIYMGRVEHRLGRD